MSQQLNSVIELLNRWGEMHWNFAAVMFIQVSVLIVVLLCLDLTVLRRLRASIRYSLWLLVLVKLMLPVTLRTPMSVSRWMPDLKPQAEMAETPRVEPVLEVVSHPVLEPPAPIETIRRPADLSHAEVPQPSVAENLTSVEAGQELSPLPGISSNPETQQTSGAAIPSVHLNWNAYVFLAWMTAVLILIVLFVRRTWMVRRIVAASSAAPEESEQALFECLRLTKVSGKHVRLRVSDDLGSPAISGFWRGTILLPRALMEKLDRRQLRSILVHELVHWRRFDLQVNCLQTLLLIVYFYNPLVWVANVIVRRAREQAVDEAVLATLDSPAEDYSTTLLDIASLSRRPAELTLRMVGVVESRKALSSRIKRILSRPIPRTARLGVTGLAGVFITGLVLLPMSGSNEPAAGAQSLTLNVVGQNDEPKTNQNDADDEVGLALIGRIIDETGRSVTDAKVEILHVDGGKLMNAKTNERGFYHFDNIDKPGRYRVTIDSERWVGLTYRDRVEVTVTAGKENTRYFALKRACRIRIRTVDEDGEPVPGVKLMVNNLAAESHFAPDEVLTDADGWVTLGGIVPSKTEYLIATWKDGYAFERLVVKLDDPQQIPAKEIVLHAGKTIKGTAVCSDGKPPAGWRIRALPSWWHFGRSPSGTKIAEDGSFALTHIGRDKYDVTISVPSGDSGSSPHQVLKQASLFETEGLLKLKMDHPSPSSMVYITGHVKIIGKPNKREFYIFASSREPWYHKGIYMRGGETEFKIGPLIKGTYQLKVENVGMEAKPVTVTAPAEDVELVVKAFDQPKLKGTVIDARTKQPVSPYRLRVYKLRTLRGPSYVQEPDWRTFKNDDGQFEYEVHGPGVYKVQIAADGYAWQFSDEINTDKKGGKPVQIALSEGVSLTGTVVDQAGQPIDGAIVVPLSRAMGMLPASIGPFDTAEGAVRTRDGKFELNHLSPGKESLKVTHPDYCFTILPDVLVTAERGDVPVRVTLTVGGTVRGRVFDAEGRPEPNVTLYFQDASGYSGGGDEEKGRFASAVTDADGFYEVHRLPSQLIYVNRADPWQSLGVVRHAILPENGQVRTLDFGGDKLLTGRLLIDGKPLADGELILAGDSPHFGIFRAQTQTQGDGSFAFRGVPPGERTLYYAVPGRRGDYGQVSTIRVTPDGDDLGTIDHVTGRLEVRIEPTSVAEDEQLFLHLQTYDPISSWGYAVGVKSRNRDNNTFTIEQIPAGKYELTCYRRNYPQYRKFIEITPDNLEQSLTWQIPVGTAVLSGSINKEIDDSDRYTSLNLWSSDGRLRATLIPDQDDGSYRMEHLPAGEYLVRKSDTRDGHVIQKVTLQEGEQKTLDFTPDTVETDTSMRGLIVVRTYNSNGVPFPCRPYLKGPAGQLTPRSSQRARAGFVGKPGTYTLVIDYPGFEPLRRQVEMQPVNTDGTPAEGYQINVFLNESN